MIPELATGVQYAFEIEAVRLRRCVAFGLMSAAEAKKKLQEAADAAVEDRLDWVKSYLKRSVAREHKAGEIDL